MTNETPSAWLERRNGELILLQERCTIGRDSGNTIVIPHERVSRRHAVVRRTDQGTYQLFDMGSSNGTYLNGVRVTRPALLTNACVVEIGGESFTFRTVGVREAAPEEDAPDLPCWLLSIEAVHPSDRHSLALLDDKTAESWSERCQRVLTRLDAKALRPGGDALLLYWPGENDPAPIFEALHALQKVQLPTEEFHLALHHALMKFRRSTAGDVIPGGLGAIHALQMQRFLRVTPVHILISRAARDVLGDHPQIQPLTPEQKSQLPRQSDYYTLM